MFRQGNQFLALCHREYNIWLCPPVTPGSVEAISHDIGTQSGSIYVWARPDSGKTLVNWSLRLLSSDPSILTFASSSVETLNPVLGNTGSPEFEDIARWEYVDEPIGNNASIDDIQGINIFQVNRTGVGIGPDSTGLPYNDPFYDSSNDAWLLGADRLFAQRHTRPDQFVPADWRVRDQ